MKRRNFLIGGTAAFGLSACAAPEAESTMQDEAGEIAVGTNSNFAFTVETTNPEGVWDLWTTPATWGSWDKGLKSARMDGQMALGSVGVIQPLRGPSSRFRVTAFDPGQSYTFETGLPGAVLRVERRFNADRTAFTHEVTFSGLTAFAFARMFGPGFRKALPPSMRALDALAAQR